MNKVYTKIESIVGNVITVRATGVKYNDLAMVGKSYANVIKLDGDLVSLQVFAGAQGVRTDDPVRFLGVPMRVSYSDNLMGRVFDGSGKPRDNGPELDENMAEDGFVDDALLKNETLDELASALEMLPDELQEIIVLRYYDGIPLTEISDKMGLSYGAVKLRHAKAVEMLRRAMHIA